MVENSARALQRRGREGVGVLRESSRSRVRKHLKKKKNWGACGEDRAGIWTRRTGETKKKDLRFFCEEGKGEPNKSISKETDYPPENYTLGKGGYMNLKREEKKKMRREA